MGDHLHVSRYVMQRITEKHDLQVSFEPKVKKGIIVIGSIFIL